MSPDTAAITTDTIDKLSAIVETIKHFASVYWPLTEQQVAMIMLSKVDVAVDYHGSFLPCYSVSKYNVIKDKLRPVIAQMFGNPDTNFLSLEKMENLQVHRGDNIMDSCFQYAIIDEERHKLLNVKVYDKFCDMLSRENTQ